MEGGGEGGEYLVSRRERDGVLCAGRGTRKPFSDSVDAAIAWRGRGGVAVAFALRMPKLSGLRRWSNNHLTQGALRDRDPPSQHPPTNTPQVGHALFAEEAYTDCAGLNAMEVGPSALPTAPPCRCCSRRPPSCAWRSKVPCSRSSSKTQTFPRPGSSSPSPLLDYTKPMDTRSVRLSIPRVTPPLPRPPAPYPGQGSMLDTLPRAAPR